MAETNNKKNEDIVKRVRRKIRNAAVSVATVAVVGTSAGCHSAGGSAGAKEDVKKEVPAKTVKSQYGTFTSFDENTPEMKRMKLCAAVLKRDLSDFKSVAQEQSGSAVFSLEKFLGSFDMLNEKDAEFMLEAMKVTLKGGSKDDGASLTLICHVKEKIRRDIREHHGIKISSDNDKGVEKFCKDQNSPCLGKLFGFCKNRVSADREKQLGHEAQVRYEERLKKELEAKKLEEERLEKLEAGKKQPKANQYENQQKEKKKKENWVSVKHTMMLLRGR